MCRKDKSVDNCELLRWSKYYTAAEMMGGDCDYIESRTIVNREIAMLWKKAEDALKAVDDKLEALKNEQEKNDSRSC